MNINQDITQFILTNLSVQYIPTKFLQTNPTLTTLCSESLALDLIKTVCCLGYITKLM